MSNLVTRGLGGTNLPTAALGGSLGAAFVQVVAGTLAMSGVVVTTFVEAPADQITYGRRMMGTFFGPMRRGTGG